MAFYFCSFKALFWFFCILAFASAAATLLLSLDLAPFAFAFDLAAIVFFLRAVAFFSWAFSSSAYF